MKVRPPSPVEKVLVMLASMAATRLTLWVIEVGRKKNYLTGAEAAQVAPVDNDNWVDQEWHRQVSADESQIYEFRRIHGANNPGMN